MNTTVERLEGNKVKVTMIVPAAEVDSRIKETYRELAQKNRFPGFRKGKAPRKVIDSFLGGEYGLALTTDQLVNELFPRAVDAEDIRPIKDADFGDTSELMVEDGKDFVVSAIIEDTPKLELSSYDPVEIELPSEKATEAEIEEQVQAMAEYYFSLEDVEREAKEKDLATIGIKTTYGELDIPAYTNEDRIYEVGSATLPEEIGSQVIGMKPGESKAFDFEPSASMLGSVEKQEDAQFHVELELKELREKIYPEINDDFARDTAGFEDLADMRAKMAESIERQKQAIIPRLKEERCGIEIAKRLEGDVPEEMIASEHQQLLSSFFRDLQRQGMTFDAYLRNAGIDGQKFQDDIKQQATDVVRESLALDALARHMGLEATQEDITEEFVKAGVADPAASQKDWEDNGRMAYIREGIRRSKAGKWVVDNAIVTEVEGMGSDEDEAEADAE